MANASNTLENYLLNSIFGNASYSANLTVKLYTSALSDAGGGTEVTGGSYAAAVVTNNTTNFPNSTTGVISNATAITFAQATASWGTVTHFGVFNDSSELVVWGALDVPKTVATNDVFSFAPSQLVCSCD
jgi:hypothetical protein